MHCLYLKDMWMSEVSLVKDEQIAESSSYQVEQSTTNISNDVQTDQLPSNALFRPARGVNVRCKEIMIGNIQYHIHLTQFSSMPPGTYTYSHKTKYTKYRNKHQDSGLLQMIQSQWWRSHWC